MQDISFTTHVFKEGEMYVAYAPELDLSSCGETPAQARANIQDAVKGLLETAEEIGTLKEVLEESGYQHRDGQWVAPEFVSVDHLKVAIS